MDSIKKIQALLSGKKAYLVALATIIYAVIYYGWMQQDWPTAINLVFGSAGLSALRAGISKNK